MPNYTKHVLLVIGDMPENHLIGIRAADAALTRTIAITRGQACADGWTLYPFLTGGDEDFPLDTKELQQYFAILTGGQIRETVGAVAMDEESWLDQDNLFVNLHPEFFRAGTAMYVARPIGVLDRTR